MVEKMNLGIWVLIILLLLLVWILWSARKQASKLGVGKNGNKENR
jgi:hypothetical protein